MGAAEIALGLDHLHGLDILYSILDGTILLDEVGHICLTGFGRRRLCSELSRESPTNTKRTFSVRGNVEYYAPELARACEGFRDGDHGKAVDWWALGTLIFEMLTCLSPF